MTHKERERLLELVFEHAGLPSDTYEEVCCDYTDEELMHNFGHLLKEDEYIPLLLEELREWFFNSTDRDES